MLFLGLRSDALCCSSVAFVPSQPRPGRRPKLPLRVGTPPPVRVKGMGLDGLSFIPDTRLNSTHSPA